VIQIDDDDIDEGEAYQSRNHKSIIHIEPPTQRPFCHQARQNGQPGCNKQNPSNDVKKRPYVALRAWLSCDKMKYCTHRISSAA
jgi:hypothetical protein